MSNIKAVNRARKARGTEPLPSLKSKKRLLTLMTIVIMIFAGLSVNLGLIVFVQGDDLQQKAQLQQTMDLVVSAKRGAILDRNNNVLAQSANAQTVVLRPAEIKNGNVDAIVSILSEKLGIDEDTVRRKATNEKKTEIWLARQVNKDVAKELLDLNLPGVYFSVDIKRYYPNGAFLTQTIGFTSVDGVGQEGLEAYFEKVLSGQDGKTISEADSEGRELALGEQENVAPVDGYNLVLTIDEVIQSFLEKSLEEACTQQSAAGAWGIAMDPNTGEILAMADYPDYDLNQPPRDNIENLTKLTQNQAVIGSFEPGSAMNAITCAAALDSGAVSADAAFDCPGYYAVDGQPVKCWQYPRAHEHQTLQQAMQNTCSAAAAQMGLTMGIQTFYDYLYGFGFGQETGSTFPSDNGGTVMAEKYVRNSDLARITFGQSIAVTPLQLISSFSSVVNGGFLFKPMIVKGMTDDAGSYIEQYEPVQISSPISAETSTKMREILEGVVSQGTGKNGYITGYRSGGISGTAQKYDEDGLALPGKYTASFISFAPADDPKIVVLIVVDEPAASVEFGSMVAAQYVRSVMLESLQYMGIAADETVSPAPAQVAVPELLGKSMEEAVQILSEKGLRCLMDGTGNVVSQLPLAETAADEGTAVLLSMSVKNAQEDLAGKVIVPDLSGLTVMEAAELLEKYHLNLVIQGAGSAAYQTPAKDTIVETGSEVRVDFSSSAG